MLLNIKLENGFIVPLDDEFKKLEDGIYEVNIKNMDMRSLAQNRAMHKYFSLLSSSLNDCGLDITKTIKVDTNWTETSVKELLWKPIQEAVLNKKSTTKLNKDEVTQVYETLNRALSQKFGLYVAFPNKED